ncbi:MAG TPA: hypothetical protein VNF00_04200 [Candidatus Acidoferrales bacterium]|nr:hypothetical protein [Candidatus Acidoferrales bacterium]
MKTTKPMLEYLATYSKISLESFELARLNDLANLRQQMTEIIDEWVEADIQARIAEWILVSRRQQAARRASRNSRRMSSKNAPLPQFPAPGDSQMEFPALAANPVFPALRDAVSDEPIRPVSRATQAIVKSKRIA